MLCKFGSHLYGTDTPLSDTDYKGIFLPSLEDVILQRVPKSKHSSTSNDRDKNTAEDVDSEIYSLHYFLKLAMKGETVALDMLHCPEDALLETSEIWAFIRHNRRRFYTKSMKAYVGYAMKQASKYGVKGSRLDDCGRVVEFLWGLRCKLADVWDDLPSGQHIRKYLEPTATQDDKRMYEVCQRKVPATCSTAYAYTVFAKFYENYGARARQAANNEGVDWKAISHAFRGGFQLKEIFLTGDLKYPLRDREFLKKVKAGALHYQDDGVGGMLDDLLEEVRELSETSGLPETVDHEFWDGLLVSLYQVGEPTGFLPGSRPCAE